MRELKSSLQEFGEFLLKAQSVRPTAGWARRFLSRPASQLSRSVRSRAVSQGSRLAAIDEEVASIDRD